MRRFPIFLIILLPWAAHAGSLRPGIPRVTWSTDHFSLTIDVKKQDLLPALGSLAEECYAKEKAFFGYAPPGRIKMVFLDEQDYANGSAYSPQEWVVIYLHQADHLLRGRTRWLPGVLSHEIGHIFTLRKMGEDTRFLGLEFFHDWRGAGPSRFREGLDWSYGRTPPWLAEGLAQYAAGVCGYDTLDTHRKMVLRVAAASGTLMTLAELKGFAWDARRNEMIYTQGYSLVSYLYATFGPRRMNRYLGLSAKHGWRGAFQPALGKDLESIYADWRSLQEVRYRPGDAPTDGEFLLPKPPGPYTVETAPTPLKDGRYLYLSSRNNDYASMDLFLADGKGRTRRIFREATSLRLSPDGRSALFTANRYSFFQGEVVSELYRFDGDRGEVERLTSGGRIQGGCESQGIVYAVRNNEGRTSVIRVVDGEFTTVYSPPDTLELTDIATGRTGKSLTLATTSGFGNDLYELDLASHELTPLAVSPQDERDPRWSGDTLYFSADYAGVFDIYAQAGGRVNRITHVSGGAFHPSPAADGIWYSAYGSDGFRLARARPFAGEAPPFIIELPVPAWPPSPPAEYEADAYDHGNLGFLGFDLALGAIRSPGHSQPADTAAGFPAVRYASGSKLETGVGLHWLNPSGAASAFAHLGFSKPLDYDGAIHLDGTDFEIRVNTFLPTVVAGGQWYTFDYPGFRIEDASFEYYQAVAIGYAGLDWRLARNWTASGRFTVRNDFHYAGQDHEKIYDSDPQPGGNLDLDYSNLDQGKDGVVRGLGAFLSGGIPPGIGDGNPDFTVDAGATLYGSLGRFLFADGSIDHSQEWGQGAKGWIYGSVSAYCAVPLGFQLGTGGGAGLYLDRIYPGIDWIGIADVPLGGESGNGYQAGYPAGSPIRPDRHGAGNTLSGRGAPGGEGPNGAAGLPPVAGFRDLVDRSMTHEVGFSLSLRTLTFFANPELWKASVHFDAGDFGREPVWSVFITL